MDHLCGTGGYTRAYLSEQFKKYFGLLHSFLKEQRLNNAARILQPP